METDVTFVRFDSEPHFSEPDVVSAEVFRAEKPGQYLVEGIWSQFGDAKWTVRARRIGD